MPIKRRRRICIVGTVPFSLNAFMRPHIERLRTEYDVTLVADGTAADVQSQLDDHVSFVPVRIERKIAPISDSVALAKLWRLFRREEFDCVHSIMPKSGLLAMAAARGAAIPLRFHTFTGQVWATRSGWMRSLLRNLDRLIVRNATMTLADSFSQRQFLIDQGVAPSASYIAVLADGSNCGVDIDRFAPDARARIAVRDRLGIPAEAVLFLFLGRLNRDKGIGDLIRAFPGVIATAPTSHLVVVGPDEDGCADALGPLAQAFPGHIHREGFTDCPEDFTSAADVLCLPTYREGFPNAILQAAAAGIPAIASRVYGVTDAVEDGATGVLYEPRSVEGLSAAMIRLHHDATLRRKLGDAARERVSAKFSEGRLTAALLEFYRDAFARNDDRNRAHYH